MTVLAQQDYPDYGRQVSQSDILIYEEIDTTILVDTTLPTRFVGSSPWLSVQFTSAAIRSAVFLSWFGDEAGNTSVGSDVIVITNAAGAFVTLPVKGPFIQPFIQLAAYPEEFFLVATTVPHPVVQWSEAGGNRVISAINETILTTATANLTAEQVVSGWVNVSAQMRAGTVATAELFWVQFDGTRNTLDRWRVDAFAPVRNLYVPPMPLELDVTNNDAGTQILDASIRHGTPGNW